MDFNFSTLLLSGAQSPLKGAKHGFPESVVLTEVPFVPAYDLRVNPKSPAFIAVSNALGIQLPTRVGDTSANALCLGPDWWLLLSEKNPESLLEKLRSEFHFSLVDVSAQRTQIEVRGPNAKRLLEHLWEQDLRPSRFPVGACSQGLMAKAPVILWHQGEGHYQIAVRASFAKHLWACLVDASVEYLESAI